MAWAGVGVEVDGRDLLTPRWEDRDPRGYVAPGTFGGRPGVEELSDILVPDAMWYQVLSRGHLDRLGGAPSGSRQLSDDRVELTIGEPEQWLPGHPDRDAVRAWGRTQLGGCLVSGEQAFTMTKQRLGQAAQRDDEGLFNRG